jgi:hypothetical protein
MEGTLEVLHLNKKPKGHTGQLIRSTPIQTIQRSNKNPLKQKSLKTNSKGEIPKSLGLQNCASASLLASTC